MPGIAGFVSGAPLVDAQARLEQMLGGMKSDSAYSSGTLLNEKLGLWAGWVSHKGSFSDCQPIWNDRRDLCLIFSGEHFGDGPGLPMEGSPESAAAAVNASCLMEVYEDEKEGFFARLNGWFVGLLVDLQNDTVTLFNDRYGLNRIYYHESLDGFHFSTEAKSLLTVLPQLRQLDQRGLAEFISVGCVLQNRSLFKDISILPGGAIWTFHRDGRLEKRRYFRPETWEQQERLTAQAYGHRLREVFSRLAPRYLQSSRPVAMSLTGGLDSRMVLAWVKAPPGSLPCYTFGGPYRDCADVRIARQLARTCRQPHTTLSVREEFFSEFASLAEETVYRTDGAMDVSGAVELHVNRLAREVAPVRLTGNYGSEILRSNIAFRPRQVDASLFLPEFGRLVREASDTYRSEAAGNRLSFIAFKQVPWHHHARLALEQSQLTLRSPFLDNELVALAFQAPVELRSSADPLLQLIALGNPELDHVRTDRALRRRPTPLVSTLANRWQEFTARAEYAYDYGMPHWLARFDQACKPLHCERLFLGRHKFYHFRVWYRDRLHEYVRACGANVQAIPECYRARAVQRIIDDHVAGRANHTLELHRLLSVQLIERLFVRLP